VARIMAMEKQREQERKRLQVHFKPTLHGDLTPQSVFFIKKPFYFCCQQGKAQGHRYILKPPCCVLPAHVTRSFPLKKSDRSNVLFGAIEKLTKMSQI